VRPDDWFPESADSGWRDLYAVDSVKARKNRFRAIEDSGQI
jgi:hypothetical protein